MGAAMELRHLRYFMALARYWNSTPLLASVMESAISIYRG